ncbi:hypothetical protein [Sporosarcina sp. FSL K6-5500]|uniref:hypothetical protein n=1 Tax=Sporosarcina sp. FSL K6-5500 TaxID=2921558 RepID=UPI0030F6A698
MKAITQTPLDTIRQQEEAIKAKDAQLQSLGFSLAEEKIKSAQKDMMIQSIGQQMTQLKIDVAELKGVGA